MKTLFKSIGWKNDTGFTSFIVNDLKRVVLQEIPNIYKDKDETTINTLLYINENNFDLKILSNKTNAKIEYYIPVNIFQTSFLNLPFSPFLFLYVFFLPICLV